MIKKFIRLGVFLGVIATLVYFSGGLQNFFKSPTAYAVGDLTVDWGVPEGSPIFTVSGAAPGQTEIRDVDVTNSSLSLKPVAVRGLLTSQSAGMSSVLDITISEDGNTLYGPVTLDQFFSDSNSSDGIPLSDLNSGAQTTYQFELTFKTEAENEFQNQTIVFDLIIGVAFTVPVECGSPAQYGTPIFGTSGNDNLRGRNRMDLIVGFDGNDIISGGNNHDCIIGGSGNNKLSGGNGNDIIQAGDGNNFVYGGNGKDVVTTGSGNDKIDGGNGNDFVLAGAGNDNISGGNGNDNLNGEADVDKAGGGLGTDTCSAETEIKCEL